MNIFILHKSFAFLILFCSINLYAMDFEENILFNSLNEPFIIALAVILGFINTQYVVWFFALITSIFYSVLSDSLDGGGLAELNTEIVGIRLITILIIYYFVNVLKRIFYDKRFGDMSKLDEE